jgi:putative ABC transport system permease protein
MFRAFSETVIAALRTLAANKLRSALTLLGIVIGVLAVVLMASVIEGLRISINEDINQLGSGVFQVQKQPLNGGGFNASPRDRARWERRKDFTMAHVEVLQEHCERCLHVAGEDWANGQKSVRTARGTVAQGVIVAGGTTHFFDNNGYALEQGRLFTDGDVAGAAAICVIGADIVDALFEGHDPVGQDVFLNNRPYRVVGTMERRGSNLEGSKDGLFVIPLTRFQQDVGSMHSSLNVTIAAKEPDKIERAQDEVVAILRRARGVPPQDENDFEMFSNESVQEDFESMLSKIQFVTIGVTMIALLIGGIGVMNIMLVAVTERISEIGVRRALGARRRRILGQFVSEAVVLCLLGGLFGILLGGFLSQLVRVFFPIPTSVPSWAVVYSLGFSSAIGLIFGIYPAWRASRLDPVEAMRHE